MGLLPSHVEGGVPLSCCPGSYSVRLLNSLQFTCRKGGEKDVLRNCLSLVGPPDPVCGIYSKADETKKIFFVQSMKVTAEQNRGSSVL